HPTHGLDDKSDRRPRSEGNDRHDRQVPVVVRRDREREDQTEGEITGPEPEQDAAGQAGSKEKRADHGYGGQWIADDAADLLRPASTERDVAPELRQDVALGNPGKRP